MRFISVALYTFITDIFRERTFSKGGAVPHGFVAGKKTKETGDGK
jgi:hypothetical protein